MFNRLLVFCFSVGFVVGQYDYAQVLGYSIWFYEAQHSGYLPSWNRVDWRGDSATDDGKDKGQSLDGGWYDAGDFVKFGLPMAQSVSVLAWGILEFRDAYEQAGEYNRALNSIRWPLEYFIKCHVSDNEFFGQVGDGHVDHQFWGRPEEMTMDRPAWSLTTNAPGSDLAGETAAAMAAGYMVFRDTDQEFANTLLDHARRLYNFAYNFRGLYHESITNAADFYRSSGYEDELAWGALWLYRATNEAQYLTQANEFRGAVSGTEWGFSWDNKIGGAQLMFHITDNDAQMAGKVQDYLNDWYPGGSVQYTPMGLAWRLMWGANRYAANTAFIALVAEKYGIDAGRAGDWAKGQIDYMLGDGPNSFVVGYGRNPPQRPHHASSSCPDLPAPCNWDDFNSPDPNPQVLWGALVGGPDENDGYEDDRADYVKNEVSCDYNAGFQGALAGIMSRQMRGY